MAVSVSCRHEFAGGVAGHVRRRACLMLDALGLRRRRLSVSLVGDREIAQLNARYRGRRAATDVLSFSLDEGPFGSLSHRMLGDVVLSVETARRVARQEHRSLRVVLDRLLLHGILHLVGYDHERSREEERRMRRKECEITRVLLRGGGEAARRRASGLVRNAGGRE